MSSEPAGGATVLDPWAEQARRRGLRRRRRVIRWSAAGIGVLLAAMIAVVVWALVARSDDPPADTAPTAVGPGSPAEVSSSSAEDGGARGSPAAQGASGRPAAEMLVEVDEAWLLGHDDGTVDWGVIVESLSDVDRGPIRIDVTFRDEAGAELAATGAVLSGVPAGGRAAAGGSMPAAEPMPARLQADVAVGRPLGEPAFDDGGLEVRSLDRRRRADGGEEITGLVVSTREDEVSALQLVLLWRDPAGSVVGSVVRDVERVRPGVAAHFTVPLVEERVPDGLPTDVMWSQRGAQD
jgi:hypothetical protein